MLWILYLQKKKDRLGSAGLFFFFIFFFFCFCFLKACGLKFYGKGNLRNFACWFSYILIVLLLRIQLISLFEELYFLIVVVLVSNSSCSNFLQIRKGLELVSRSFLQNFSMKNFSFVVRYKLVRFHYQNVFTSQFIQ